MSEEQLLRLPAVLAKTGLGRSTLYALVLKGEFPKPIKLGIRSVAWPHSVVQAFIDRKIRESDKATA